MPDIGKTHAAETRGSVPHLAIWIPTIGGGGAERIMVLLANELSRKGWRVDIVIARHVTTNGHYPDDIVVGVRVVDLKARRLAFALPALVRYFRREKPDICFSVLNEANVLALLARRLTGGPRRLVISERNTLTAELRASSVKHRILRLLIRRTYAYADAVIANSHGVAEDLAAFLPHLRVPVHVIHNPLELERIEQLGREQVGAVPERRPLILAAGRLHPQKDFPCLLRAFTRIRQRREASLVILGDGDLRAELEGLARNLGVAADVHMPGFVKNPFAWMRGADLFVLSSAWEGCPNVLMQAMASGARVVSSDCRSGPAEILENGRWGRLVPVGDEVALARAMEEALDDPTPPDVRARARDFHHPAILERYRDVLEGRLVDSQATVTAQRLTRSDYGKIHGHYLPQ